MIKFVFILGLLLWRVRGQPCRCFPGDACWPSDATWGAFNTTLQGRLVKTHPLASACHDDQFEPYSQTKCASLQRVWEFPETHFRDSASIMAQQFANMSCDPFLPRQDKCVVGALVQYSVNVSSVTDIQTALRFASKHNIRLVIRNTGHDYLGKSNGPGAIAIWVHHMKDMAVVDYSSPAFKGKACKIGAGAQVDEVQSFLSSYSLRVMGSNCPTLGLAGGFTQGGGHGPLASQYGLAADQALEWEVVTSNGTVLRATSAHNADLYWALSGGGGGTYGIVTSVTVKAFDDGPVSSMNMMFPIANLENDVLEKALAVFLHNLIPVVDAGASIIWVLTSQALLIAPTTAPNLSKLQLDRLWEPMLSHFKIHNLTFQYYSHQFPTYLASYTAMNPPANVTQNLAGARLIPRSVITGSSSALILAFRNVIQQQGLISGVTVNVAKRSTTPENSVSRAWRDALVDIGAGLPYSETNETENKINERTITNNFIPPLVDLTPGGGSYLSEADPNTKNWQEAFYGTNYARLKLIKDKYDSAGLFYALTAVGSDEWEQRADGRLCKVC